MAQTKLNVSKI